MFLTKKISSYNLSRKIKWTDNIGKKSEIYIAEDILHAEILSLTLLSRADTSEFPYSLSSSIPKIHRSWWVF